MEEIEGTITAPTGRPSVMRNLFPEAPPRPINTLEFTYGTKEIPRLDMRYDDVVEDEDLNLVVTATSVMR